MRRCLLAALFFLTAVGRSNGQYPPGLDAGRRIEAPARNVRITVTHDRGRLDEGRGHAASGHTVTRARTRQEILVMSGGKASILVAEQVPHADWFWTWGEPLGLWVGTSRWQEVGASLVVSPVVMDDGAVRVSVTPTFSYFLDRERRSTEVQRLSTEIVVRPGDEVDLGSIGVEHREFLDRFLIGYNAAGGTERVRITLRVRVE